MARSDPRVDSGTLTRAERSQAAMLARLLSEDWAGMTAAATASPNHVSSMERWIARARELNPGLTDEQARRVAPGLKKDHYRRLGRLGAEARKLARQAQAEFDRAGAAADDA